MPVNSRTLPWKIIPKYLKVIRACSYAALSIFALFIVLLFIASRKILEQPNHERGIFTERYVIKGSVHYMTKNQAVYYGMLNYGVYILFFLSVILFISHNIFEYKIRRNMKQ
jgi:hypothetical protein